MRKIAKKQFNIENLKIDKQMFNPVYFEHIQDYSHRYNLYYGGRNSGKSYFLADKLILLGLTEKRRMLFLIKQTNRVDETVWKITLNALEKFQLYEFCIINKSNHTIELPNGTWIKMSGMDSSEKAKGYVDIDTVWFEECTDFLEDDIDAIDGTLRGKVKNKQIYFSMNPVSMQNWVYKYFGFDTGIIPPDTFILKTTYKNNKWCDPKEVQRLERLKERNPARYKIEALGDFATLSKLILSYTAKDINVDELLKENTELITCIGLDWGFNHPTTVICSLYNQESKTLYVIDEIYVKGVTNSDIAKLIKEKGWHKEIIYADSANPKDIADLKKMGINKIKPAKKGKGSIMNSVRKLEDMDIIINTKCVNTIANFDNWCWAKDKFGNYIDEPIDIWDDCIDSIRYSLGAIRRVPKLINIRL